MNIKENEDGSYDVEVSGNDAIYGRNTVYRRNYSGGMFRNLAMFYFMNRMMNPYRSSYGYGRRPMDTGPTSQHQESNTLSVIKVTTPALIKRHQIQRVE